MHVAREAFISVLPMLFRVILFGDCPFFFRHIYLELFTICLRKYDQIVYFKQVQRLKDGRDGLRG